MAARVKSPMRVTPVSIAGGGTKRASSFARDGLNRCFFLHPGNHLRDCQVDGKARDGNPRFDGIQPSFQEEINIHREGRAKKRKKRAIAEHDEHLHGAIAYFNQEIDDDDPVDDLPDGDPWHGKMSRHVNLKLRARSRLVFQAKDEFAACVAPGNGRITARLDAWLEILEILEIAGAERDR
jgi:hypothetical protein